MEGETQGRNGHRVQNQRDAHRKGKTERPTKTDRLAKTEMRKQMEETDQLHYLVKMTETGHREPGRHIWQTGETEIKTEEIEQKWGWGRLRNGRTDAWYWDREWERPQMSAAIFYHLDGLTFPLKGRAID